MMNILLNLPRDPNDWSFFRGPSLADDEYPVEDISSNEVNDESATSDTSKRPE